jgi:xylose dehydrogenase (NAD/NADP)
MLEAPSVDLIGVASRSSEKAESFRSEFRLPRAYQSYDEMLDDPEIQAIYNPLPNGLHGCWMVRAAEKGKHTLCEKPFASNAAEAERVAEAGRRAGVKLMEGFMWRFHPQHLRARQIIESGAIGAVRLVRAAFSFSLTRQPNVRLDPGLAGGSVMDIGCYPISAARFYFEAEPVTAYALGEIDPEHGVDMRMSGLLDFPRGRALIDCGFDLPYRTSMEIVGEKGMIFIPRAWLPEEEAEIMVDGKEERLPRANQYVNEFEHFSQCVLQDTPPRYGPDDAVLQMRVIDAVLRSIRSRQPERISDLRPPTSDFRPETSDLKSQSSDSSVSGLRSDP